MHYSTKINLKTAMPITERGEVSSIDINHDQIEPASSANKEKRNRIITGRFNCPGILFSLFYYFTANNNFSGRKPQYIF